MVKKNQKDINELINGLIDDSDIDKATISIDLLDELNNYIYQNVNEKTKFKMAYTDLETKIDDLKNQINDKNFITFKIPTYNLDYNPNTLITMQDFYEKLILIVYVKNLDVDKLIKEGKEIINNNHNQQWVKDVVKTKF